MSHSTFVIPPHLRRFDPTYDVLFKYLFEDEELLKGLLNRVLHLQEGELIAALTYLDRQPSPDQHEHRGVIFDLLVTDQADKRYEIEIQRSDVGAQLNRALYYGARLLGAQLREGEGFDELLPVHVVMFTKFTLFADVHPVRTFYPTPYLVNEASSQLTLEETTPHLEPFDFRDVSHYAQRARLHKKERELKEMRELLSVTIIELTKPIQALASPAQQCLTVLSLDAQEPSQELTMNSAAHPPQKKLYKPEEDPWVQSFYKRLERFAGDPEHVADYERVERALRDHVTMMSYATETGREEGFRDGEEVGLKRGLEQGLEQGLERGKLLALKWSVAALKQLGQPEDELKRLLQLTHA